MLAPVICLEQNAAQHTSTAVSLMLLFLSQQGGKKYQIRSRELSVRRAIRAATVGYQHERKNQLARSSLNAALYQHSGDSKKEYIKLVFEGRGFTAAQSVLKAEMAQEDELRRKRT